MKLLNLHYFLLFSFACNYLLVCQAQDFGFSQYHLTPFLTNPAMIGSDNAMHARLHYRLQPVPNGENITTPMLGFSYPLFSQKTQKQFAGVGLSIINDRATQFLNTFAGVGAFAYRIDLGKSILSIGLQAGYFNRRVDATNLSTSEQYVNGRFNSSLPNGITIDNERVGYFNTSVGAFWTMFDKQEHQKAFLGIAGANLNQPALKFSPNDVSKIPIFLNVTAGYNLLPTNSKLIAMPNIRLTNFAANTFMNAGSWFRYKLDQPQTTIGTGIWYNTNGVLVTSLEWMSPNWVVALSYDFSLNDKVQTWQRAGSTEITLGFRKPITPKCKDTDKDQVCDKEDDCPTEPGKVELKGCPDRDGDSIRDKDDDCPDEAGKVELKGCPDRDGDGIRDKDDECPDQPGKLEYKGCPDRDGDTVRDKDDACPDEPGKPELRGCPEITKEEEKILEKASHVQFRTGSAIILPEWYPALDEVVTLLKNHPKGYLRLEGHTDSDGDENRNMQLSKDRANAVKNYFVRKGIDASRIETDGFGETRPIADNKTEEGKRQNRRVEMKFSSVKK
ncbi:MAG: PorP/SprF family type IX secretion system membrane protein [Microscillaceae bacterium]|nr:PorP/SprF family type IX secretion system membrane protein [Microscillaceae bacterium]MDW8460433.1 PorP/SprF family type IX secretion system membrane protein [Cytophagales bacterium]